MRVEGGVEVDRRVEGGGGERIGMKNSPCNFIPTNRKKKKRKISSGQRASFEGRKEG